MAFYFKNLLVNEHIQILQNINPTLCPTEESKEIYNLLGFPFGKSDIEQ